MAFAALFLSIFLSCNVKKGIQHYFGAEVAKPLNVSKTTVSEHLSCQTLSEQSLTAAPEEQAVSFPFVAAFFLTSVLFPVTKSDDPIWLRGLVPLKTILPLFLLYRKLIL